MSIADADGLEAITGGEGWRETMRALATGMRALVLRHPWLSLLSTPQVMFELTPNRMALAERVLAALRGLDLDAHTMMSVFRTVSAYALGATGTEIGLRRLMEDRGWTTGDETRTGLSAQMTWLLSTGRYPEFERDVREGARKDDLRWQFETGLERVLDGIAALGG